VSKENESAASLISIFVSRLTFAVTSHHSFSLI
jgi:hypothetical protein